MKRSIWKRFMPIMISACILTFVAACGSSDDDDSSTQQQEQQPDEGVYEVFLTPLNGSVVGGMSGRGDISIQGDNVSMSLDISNAPAAIHPQYIYLGGACPTLSNDGNVDGIVDIMESQSTIGKIIIPLDADLASQDLGITNFPSGATYNYNESTSLSLMMTDLRAPDLNPNDNVVKLTTEQSLNLAGRVVLLYGVPETTILPSTVRSDDPNAQTPHARLPIACGVISRVSIL